MTSHLCSSNTPNKTRGGALTTGDIYTYKQQQQTMVLKHYCKRIFQQQLHNSSIEPIVAEENSNVVYANTYTSPKAGDLWADGGDEATIALH